MNLHKSICFICRNLALIDIELQCLVLLILVLGKNAPIRRGDSPEDLWKEPRINFCLE